MSLVLVKYVMVYFDGAVVRVVEPLPPSSVLFGGNFGGNF